MKNRYGVDASYHTGKLNQIIRDIDNYTPDELARSLLRLANVADGEVFTEKEFTRPVKVKPLVWSAYDNECEEVVAVGSTYFVEKSSDTDWLYSVNGSIELEDYSTKEEAKKDAEEHYKKIVLECIEC